MQAGARRAADANAKLVGQAEQAEQAEQVKHSQNTQPKKVNLIAYAWLSVAAAVITIALKTGAYFLTGSVGLLSDAAESLVNLVAAVIALLALIAAGKPADTSYQYGRTKAEYFSSAVEGAMIFVAAAVIIVSAVDHLLHPQPLSDLGWGILVVAIASVLNGAVGIILLRAGTKHRSISLEADGKHLLTDVATSVGVVVGIGLVAVTGWEQLDPIIAILVAVNILFTGTKLVRESLAGLMDAALPAAEIEKIVQILRSHARKNIRFHGLQTRVSGRDSYANLDMLVPGSWTVWEGHEAAEDLAEELRAAVPGLRVLIHVEPLEDPRSYEDIPEGYVPLGGVVDAIPDVVIEALTEPEPVPEPGAERGPKPVSEPVPEPGAERGPKPVSEPVPEPGVAGEQGPNANQLPNGAPNRNRG
ncbi:Uncharacterized transporter sll1263 [Actinobaculum suis]|uniref:Uncharacterized transporter sll1263 n=1 Tax=Actinobaculum suis TaxID=1657 RepID=A0A7Z9C8U7_9ACTO|nr:Uncharacterized transporter sll1263 [Actinobaculum suis]